MLSLIICSQHPVINPSLEQNLAATIGCDYEIVHIDNSEGQYNIFQAYNIGVQRAQGDILCFMHEDIRFHTNDWGKRVEAHMADDEVGALGVAGGYHVAKELDWRFYGFTCINLIQGNYTLEPNPRYYRLYEPVNVNVNVNVKQQVAVLDGVWICIKKELVHSTSASTSLSPSSPTIRFDDITFHDFHLYDTDICMQINQMGKGVYVCSDIILEHCSMGRFSQSFKESLALFFAKWNDMLPLTKGCNILEKDIAEKIALAKPAFETRLRDDTLAAQLQQKMKSPTFHFTKEELKLMEESLYLCCRSMMKSTFYSTAAVWNVVKDYCKASYATRRLSLVAKFLRYRICT